VQEIAERCAKVFAKAAGAMVRAATFPEGKLVSAPRYPSGKKELVAERFDEKVHARTYKRNAC